ncbi:MAG: glycosyltransferase [Phycisphaerales bacterium]|nr:MAG: glycosyltransferase [Phycisphaerales bacterium]
MPILETTAPPTQQSPIQAGTVSPTQRPGTDAASRASSFTPRYRCFYDQRKEEYIRFAVPEGESVLVIGCGEGDLLSVLEPRRGVGIDDSPEVVTRARSRFPEYNYFTTIEEASELGETYEFVVINGATEQTEDVFTLLLKTARLCTPTSRLVIVQQSHLWQAASRAWDWLAAKPEARRNRLSVADVCTILEGAGFEATDVRRKLFCPLRLLGIGPLINAFAGVFPLLDRLCSTEIIIARKIIRDANPAAKSASIVLTTRNEHGNIEPVVQAIPKLGASTEIIFVEGHSTDGTRAEIERVIQTYPEKNIRLLVQDGAGPGDAIYKGFCEATGDVIVLLEADQTSLPEDVLKAFEMIAAGRAEYVNGSRFIYPREAGSMPGLNIVGNQLFALWFSWFLRLRTTDVLCGIKGIDRRQFSRLRREWGFLNVFDPFGDFELIFGASRLGLKIAEVPTRYNCRQYGETKTRLFAHGMMLLRIAARAVRVFKCR